MTQQTVPSVQFSRVINASQIVQSTAHWRRITACLSDRASMRARGGGAVSEYRLGRR